MVEPAITSPRSAASTWRSRSRSACSMRALKACSTVRPASTREARLRVRRVSSAEDSDRARKCRAAGRVVGGDDLDAVGREALVAQRRARLARAVGLQHAPVELAFDRVGLVAESWHVVVALTPGPSPGGRGERNSPFSLGRRVGDEGPMSSSPSALRPARSCRRAPSAARPRAGAPSRPRSPCRGCRARRRCRGRCGGVARPR